MSKKMIGREVYTEFPFQMYGSHGIKFAIATAISVAGKLDKFAGNSHRNTYLVTFKFNEIVMRVCKDSCHELIYRDWLRVSAGYITGVVGPYPKQELSLDEILRDEKLSLTQGSPLAKEAAVRRATEERMKESQQFFSC